MRPKNQHNRPTAKPQRPEPGIPELYQIVVQCADENDQRALYERLAAENRTCRLIIL